MSENPLVLIFMSCVEIILHIIPLIIIIIVGIRFAGYIHLVFVVIKLSNDVVLW